MGWLSSRSVGKIERRVDDERGLVERKEKIPVEVGCRGFIARPTDSQRKLSEQQSRLFKKKQRQHPTAGSGSHRAVPKSVLITISY